MAGRRDGVGRVPGRTAAADGFRAAARRLQRARQRTQPWPGRVGVPGHPAAPPAEYVRVGGGVERGQHALRHLRQTNAALRSSVVAAAATLAGAGLALAVGLWGPGVLTGSPLDSLRMALRPSTATGSDGSGGSGFCGSSGSSSWGGGCGGRLRGLSPRYATVLHQKKSWRQAVHQSPAWLTSVRSRVTSVPGLCRNSSKAPVLTNSTRISAGGPGR